MRRPALIVLMLLIGGAYGAAQPTPLQTVMVGRSFTYAVRPGDTVSSIAARFGVTTAALIEGNALKKPYVLAVDRALTVDNSHLAVIDPRGSITINIPQRLLVVTGNNGTVEAFPVTVGSSGWRTPLGEFTIVDKETDPVWDVPVSIQREMAEQGKPVITRMEPSPANPLGAHWLRLSLPGIGIHGTNAPSSIYRFASHGCIRMHPDDVAALFARVAEGTIGVVIYQPVTIAVIDGEVWLEANPDAYRKAPDALQSVREAVQAYGVADRVDWTMVKEVLRLRRGRPVNVTMAE